MATAGAFVSDAADANQYYLPNESAPISSTDVATGVMTAGATITGLAAFERYVGATYHNGTVFAISQGLQELVTIDMITGVGSVIGTPTSGHRLDALASPTR